MEPSVISISVTKNQPPAAYASTPALLAKLDTLPEEIRLILSAFAVMHDPVNLTTIKSLLDLLNWKDAKGGKLSGLMSGPFCKKLADAGLLIPTSNNYYCPEVIANVLSRRLSQRNEFKPISVFAAGLKPLAQRSSRIYWHDPDLHRRIHNCVYNRDWNELHDLLNHPQDYSARITCLHVLCTQPFDAEWFSTLPEDIQFSALIPKLNQRLMPDHAPEHRYLLQHWRDGKLTDPNLRSVLAKWQLSNANLDGIEDLLSAKDDPRVTICRAWLLCLQGDYDLAIPLFEEAQKSSRKILENKQYYIDGSAGLYFLIALVASKNPKHKALLKSQLNLITRVAAVSNDGICSNIIGHISAVLDSTALFKDCSYLSENYRAPYPEVHLLRALAWHWLDETPSKALLNMLAQITVQQHELGDRLFVIQCLALLKHYQHENPSLTGYAELLKRDMGPIPPGLLLNRIQPLPAWELSLNALRALTPTTSAPISSAAPEGDSRLIWLLHAGRHELSLEPKLLKATKKGWTSGRAIALKRLRNEASDMPFLSAMDKTMAARIQQFQDYYSVSYELPVFPALATAVGHSYLYWADKPDTPISLTEGEPELIVREHKDGLHLTLHPTADWSNHDGEWRLCKESEFRLRLIRLSLQHRKIESILGDKGLTVPLAARQQVLDSIGAIAPLLAIQSDIGGASVNSTERPADTSLYMQIRQDQDVLRFNLLTYPLGQDGPCFRPGEGRTTVMTEISRERVHTERNLKQERAQLKKLLVACQRLDQNSIQEHDCEWLADGEEALEILLELQEYSQQKGVTLSLLWPKGKPLTLQRQGSSQFKATIRQAQNWFELDGQLNMDDGQVLSLAKLMSLLEESPGRFVKLDAHTFLTLSEQLRKRLDAIRTHGEQQRFHPLAAMALEEITADMQIKGDKAWKQQTQRIREAYELTPEPPATLQAQLRDYQLDGFRWLSRLAHWGAGACLADDMGLGKTIQALALILTRAAKGATLILAPTSVCMNWLSEADRFAPTLNVLRFGSGDRQQMLEQLGPNDLLVCSYGLLQTEQEMLANVHWQTIVADEAQALKNLNTKRTHAALSLKGEFKVATTGTPIENHLGELWTLFRFINPGLLGSLDSFNERFASPIENHHDKAAKQHLKALVQPFILRRLKRDVLTELPARTEITITVPQSEEEKVFYEALRRKAIEKLTAEPEEGGGAAHIKVLAEIMRLRRACCHPQLVMPESSVASSKLKAFTGILEELRENRHRALVFSQFVDHLKLIRDYLDAEKIPYQYLDGSTSVKQRERAVNEFQNGEGDLFLISLKAGGSGLNLTAADYVVHMDPWWNPAVEDQASDRAHRMGQTRPVTIYRLVMENTIEQKILALHSQKRDLADSLLEGSDVSSKLGLEEMMKLIAG